MGPPLIYLRLSCSRSLKLAHDGLERQFNSFKELGGARCVHREIKEKSSGGQRTAGVEFNQNAGARDRLNEG